jgi:hypothetical protein
MAQETSPASTSTAGTAGVPPATASGAAGASQADRTSHGFADRVKERASAGLSNQKDRASEGLGTVAQAVRQSTQQLRDQNHETIARYVDQAAEQIERFSSTLRQKDINDIVNDASRLARRQPALFIGSAFAIGLLGARFMKSSRETGEGYEYEGADTSSARTGPRTEGQTGRSWQQFSQERTNA